MFIKMKKIFHLDERTAFIKMRKFFHLDNNFRASR